MDLLAEEAKFRLEHVVQAIKGKYRVHYVKLDKPARNRLILERTDAGQVMFPGGIAARFQGYGIADQERLPSGRF